MLPCWLPWDGSPQCFGESKLEEVLNPLNYKHFGAIQKLKWDFSNSCFFRSAESFLTFPMEIAVIFSLELASQDLGLRVPGDAFQISTLEAHDAMVKFGSMPQILAALLRWYEMVGFFGDFGFEPK